MAEAELYVCEERAFEGSGRYYKRLERRYKGDGRSAADGKARATPVVCVNLLRTQPGKPELVSTFTRVLHLEMEVSCGGSRSKRVGNVLGSFRIRW